MTEPYQIVDAIYKARTAHELIKVLAAHRADIQQISDACMEADYRLLRLAAIIHLEIITDLTFADILMDLDCSQFPGTPVGGIPDGSEGEE